MKKFLTTLLMLTCILGLTACNNGEKKALSYDHNMIVSQSVFMAELVGNVSVDELEAEEKYLNLNDDGLDLLASDLYKYSSVKTQGDVIIKGIESWNNNIEDLGEVEKITNDGVRIDAKEDELIVSVPLKASSHNGTVEIIYDKNLHITSVTTNTIFSFGEYMKKAATNTAIGMGTVFVMLIAIMFIIMALGLLSKVGNKPQDTAKSDSVDKAIEGIVAREEATDDADDTELVAVIAAAVAAYEGASGTDSFVVRSIKRIR